MSAVTRATFTPRTGILTGASGGLGRLLTIALAERGVRLALVALPGDRLRDVHEAAAKAGTEAIAIPADLTERTAPRRVVHEAREALGDIDLLVNGAGVERVGRFEEVTADTLRSTVAVNLSAAMELTRLVLPGMLDRDRGAVVNLASLAAHAAPAYNALYAATKAGLLGFTRSLRLEYADSAVTFSAVLPGWVERVGMYARLEREGVEGPRLAGRAQPEAVVRAVLRAIVTGDGEIIVNSPPIRPFIALGDLSPRLRERITQWLGVTDFYREVVDASLDADLPPSVEG